MEHIEIYGVDQDIYKENINGLDVYFLPFKNKNNFYMSYFTKYGSIDTEFFSFEDNKFIKTPEGIAHFLEHKMFEQENGEDPFEFFARSGTGCNASTNFDVTKYYIYGNNKPYENLDYLISYVNSPYFTGENVEKEKGIIAEEITMCQDDPDWKIQDLMQKALFNIHPMRNDIAGEVSDIETITKEDLYKCYNVFYNPHNMALFVGGNLDKDKVFDVVRKNETLKKKKLYNKIQRKKYDEDVKVVTKFQEQEVDKVTIPKLGYTLKISLKDYDKKDYPLINMYLGMILNILFGSSSDFREEGLKNNYFTKLFIERTLVDDLSIVEFWAETNRGIELQEKINETLDNAKSIITKEDVERNKKVWISTEVMISDNIQTTINLLINDIIRYEDIQIDRIKKIREMNYQDLIKYLELLNYQNSTVLIAKPKETK